jgi:two-component system, OmpR family, sensor histidine kinase KdpD
MKPSDPESRFGPAPRVDSRRASVAKAIVVIALTTGIAFAALPHIGYRSVSILYLIAIISLAFLVGRTAVVSAAVASTVLFAYLFVPTRFALLYTTREDILLLALYMAAATMLAFVLSGLRRSQADLARREKQLSQMFELSQALSVQQNLAGVARTSVEHAQSAFGVDALVFVRNDAGGLDLAPGTEATGGIDAREVEAARRCLVERSSSGRTAALASAGGYHYVPLVAGALTVGVLGIRPGDGSAWRTEEGEALPMLARALALAIERELLAEDNRRRVMARESERLGRVLLNSISHELRTPLTTIKGSTTALMDESTAADPEARGILLSETIAAADRLNEIVENLLSMTRLESGQLRLRLAEVDVEELASVASDVLRGHGAEHPLTVRVAEDLPPVMVDQSLMTQVLSNILRNAAAHTPAGTPVELSAETSGHDVIVTVSDGGPGVAADEIKHLFEPFFRGRAAASGGVGLGLSICKGIVEAHGGKISACAGPLGGLAVSIVLPGAVAGRGSEAPRE